MVTDYTNCIFFILKRMNIIIKTLYLVIIFGMYGVVSETEYREVTTKTGEIGSSLSAAFAPTSGLNRGTHHRRENHE